MRSRRGSTGTAMSIVKGPNIKTPIKGGTPIFKAKYPGICGKCKKTYPKKTAIYVDKKTRESYHGYVRDCTRSL